MAAALKEFVSGLFKARCAEAPAANVVLSPLSLKALNEFGLGLFKALCAEAPAANVVLSPLSLKTCLSMVAAGATEGSASQQEMAKVLGSIAPVVVDKAVESFNSAWVRSGIEEDYIANVTKTYCADVFPLPKPDPAGINAWVKERTRGRIDELFKELDPLTVLVLANAVLFKGTWGTKFDAGKTVKGNFVTAAGKTVPCHMMRRKDKDMHHRETPEVDAVRLPYVGGLSATILLPKAQGVDGMAKLVSSLSADVWGKLHADLSGEKTELDLSLPRFELEFCAELKEPLKALGMPTPFLGEDKGAFLRMSRDPLVHIDCVAHRATIQVNEEGTVAAAATGAVMETRCFSPPPLVVTVDRPFLLLIADEAGALVFTCMAGEPKLS